MKRVSLYIISMFIAILSGNNCFAQVVDPLNQNKKVQGEWSAEAETVISKKKNNDSKVENKNVNNILQS